MRVTLSVSLEPGYRPGLYALDITAQCFDRDDYVSQRDLLHDVVYSVEPSEDTDIRLWAIALMRSAMDRTESELYEQIARGIVKLTVSDFKHQEH